jgi:hypothetical protein
VVGELGDEDDVAVSVELERALLDRTRETNPSLRNRRM